MLRMFYITKSLDYLLSLKFDDAPGVITLFKVSISRLFIRCLMVTGSLTLNFCKITMKSSKMELFRFWIKAYWKSSKVMGSCIREVNWSAWAWSWRKESAKNMAIEVETSSWKARVSAKTGTALVDSLKRINATSSWCWGFVNSYLIDVRQSLISAMSPEVIISSMLPTIWSLNEVAFFLTIIDVSALSFKSSFFFAGCD